MLVTALWSHPHLSLHFGILWSLCSWGLPSRDQAGLSLGRVLGEKVDDSEEAELLCWGSLRGTRRI